MKALIFYGGWDGHQPKEVSEILESRLKAKGFDLQRSNTLDCLKDAAALKALDVIIPVWTGGELSPQQWKSLNEAVRAGVGLGGVHGGMGDAFRGNLEYQWMTGGQFVGHPHVGEYEVRLTAVPGAITDGLPQSWKYNSEQYYMLTDPGNVVLADSFYNFDGRRAIMPVVWTKTWGKGRVFYSALGHAAKEFSDFPHVLEMTVRGIIWAAEGKSKAGCCG